MPYDVDELRMVRLALRRVYYDLIAQKFRSPEARSAIGDIDSLCIEITNEIEAFEPELPLSPAAFPMRVGGSVR
jgi:hypothetical protein